ncbi:hypothetical protein YDYSG_04360 [Paenibacillus tyrfis]|nr:hypothetical protein YDYSG_04360 [Paenibacillus tyrfis]
MLSLQNKVIDSEIVVDYENKDIDSENKVLDRLRRYANRQQNSSINSTECQGGLSILKSQIRRYLQRLAT